jgi:hypothetical protein
METGCIWAIFYQFMTNLWLGCHLFTIHYPKHLHDIVCSVYHSLAEFSHRSRSSISPLWNLLNMCKQLSSYHNVAVFVSVQKFLASSRYFTEDYRWFLHWYFLEICCSSLLMCVCMCACTHARIDVCIDIYSYSFVLQHKPVKRWYPTITLHSIIIQKTLTWNCARVFIYQFY